MHLKILFDEWFKHREFWNLKKTSEDARIEIHAAKRETNEKQKLAKFKTILDNMDNLIKNDPHVQRAVESLSDKDGIAYKMSPGKVTAGYVTALGTLFTIAGGGFMAATVPFVAAPLAIVAVGLMIAGYKARYYVRAKELGCKASDVKYAFKLEKQHRHVEHIVHRLESDEPTLKKVQNLRSTFTMANAKKKRHYRGSHRKSKVVAQNM